MQSPLLDIAETAARLGVAPKTLYKWLESGRIPFVRIGRLVRFREEDLEAWVNENTRRPDKQYGRLDLVR